MRSIQAWIEEARFQRYFVLLVFLWSLLTGLFIQKVLLVYIFPAMNAGSGILVGTDGISFHQLAVDLAAQIDTRGWSAWTLCPQGQPVAGILAIFYALFTPQPWVILPWNALLHALAARYLILILLKFFPNKNKAYLAVLPFAFFFSAFTWTAQMHNENYAVLGSILLMYSAVSASEPLKEHRLSHVTAVIIPGMIGALLVLMVRTYMYEMLFVFSTFALLLHFLLRVIKFIFHKLDSRILIKQVLPILLFVLVQIGMVTVNISSIKPQPIRLAPTAETAASGTQPSNLPQQLQWDASAWLPAFVDQKILQMVSMRTHQLAFFPDGATNIDQDVAFTNALDVMRYLPRAMQIGFLSPFPQDWLSSGSKITSRSMRLVTMGEMIIAYAALIPLLLWISRNMQHAPAATFVWICCAMITTYAIGMPNIGTIYRFRYVFYTPLVGIGLAALLPAQRPQQ